MFKKILIVFGTRPEAIKMVPVIKEFQKKSAYFETRVCVTAQHREMLDKVLEIFDIKPYYDLDIMTSNQNIYNITSSILLKIKIIFDEFKPDLVLVHGDTTTAMVTSLASFYSRIKIGHVEAGLRTYDFNAPWPEEMNRQVIDRICDFHFAPTTLSKKNLQNENINKKNIFVTGNTIIDALFLALNIIEKNKFLKNKINKIISEFGYEFSQRKYILVTGHRRENFGEKFQNICNALKNIAIQHPYLDIVYPVHMNPNVQKPVLEILSEVKNIYLLPPLDYFSFIYAMKNSFLIITDSGGIQEEAPSLGKPVLVLRNITERPEAVKAGTVKLIGNNYKKIIKSINELLNNNDLYKKMTEINNPYGDGKAAEKIVKIIHDNLFKE